MAYSQVNLLAATILGEWQTSEGDSFNYHYYLFKDDGELEMRSIQTKQTSKSPGSKNDVATAVYVYGQKACKFGEISGELYIAKDSERCCFKVNTVGNTLVLDQIKRDPDTWRGICDNKTLRRTRK